ncbi:MAG TPA: helix-turn-helix domain-containing protein [Bryobacteraceae bacterium]|nr:helix-turn-helix domain-containing protein [Bryobacteraceae bacterium]
MVNPTKRLREALKMSQQQFATELGISVGSVRAYERGVQVSDASLEAMKSLAVRQGLGDLALEMTRGRFAVGKLIAPQDAGKSVRLRKSSHGRDLGDDLHAALDAILETGSPEAIGAIEFLLRTLRDHAEAPPKRSRR